MALRIYDSGEEPLSTPTGFLLADLTGPGAFVALIDLEAHDGLEVIVRVVTNDITDPCEIFRLETTVVVGGTEPAAILTPPLPVATTGAVWFEWTAGTPGSPSTLPWVVYQL